MKVCVDPGHGMSNRSNNVYDPGATHTEGSTRHEEATIALKYGLALKDVFRGRGVSVFMTRDDGTDQAPVGWRAGAAKDAGCDVFISLHLNDVDDDSANGTETLYRDNGDIELAKKLQRAMLGVTNLKDRGVKQRTDLSVLKFDGPASLLELGFIANDTDRAKLLDNQIRSKICEAVADATMEQMGWTASPRVLATAPDWAAADRMRTTEGGDSSEAGYDLNERDWDIGERSAYDLNSPLVRGEVPLTLDGFRAVFGETGVTSGFDMAEFAQLVSSWNLRHFSAAELLFLGSAHYGNGPCRGRNALPPQDLWRRMENTARMADEVRHRFGHPVRVLSGYRNAQYNNCIGGESGSMHMVFNALDLAPQGGSMAQFRSIARQVRDSDSRFRGGIGYYPGGGFVHLDTRGTNANWGPA